jgi:radical SAM enzyme (TIGR01210 family)
VTVPATSARGQAAADRRIRSLRPPKPYVDPFVAHGIALDEERRPNGGVEGALTIFLAGGECPFTCSFCDLWKWTTDEPTPVGALPAQIESILTGCASPLPERLKLYNASNFFDRRTVPLEDLPAIAALAAPFAGVTVESHVNTIGPSTVAFAQLLAGRLEVAVGLETVHPVAAKELNKRFDLARFDRAAHFLAEKNVDLRVFVLLGAPYVPVEETVSWTVRSVEYAVGRGATVVSIIPVRGGNGEIERLQALGAFAPPTLSQLEDALDECIRFTSAVVTVDLWDIDRLTACATCRDARVARLGRINLTGRAEPRVVCTACGLGT